MIEHQTLIQYVYCKLCSHLLCGCRPLPLSLPTTSESVIIDNMDVFQKNGFKFIIDEEGKSLIYSACYASMVSFTHSKGTSNWETC